MYVVACHVGNVSRSLLAGALQAEEQAYGNRPKSKVEQLLYKDLWDGQLGSIQVSS